MSPIPGGGLHPLGHLAVLDCSTLCELPQLKAIDCVSFSPPEAPIADFLFCSSTSGQRGQTDKTVVLKIFILLPGGSLNTNSKSRKWAREMDGGTQHHPDKQGPGGTWKHPAAFTALRQGLSQLR